MMQKKKKQTCLVILLLSVAIVLVCIAGNRKTEPYTEAEIAFSVEESFLSESRELTLTTPVEADIYYTLDGSTPSDASAKYTEPIELEAGDEIRGIPVRAVAYYGDGSTSEVCTRTYLTGTGISDRFHNLVVEISTDPDNLYDYDNGILVAGRLWDDYLAENPDAEATDRTPANFNLRGDSSERAANVEFWNPDGSRILTQDVGIRVHGGTSRGANMKSLRLIARREYGKSRLEEAFFPDLTSERTEKVIERYKRVLLRNHGNDQEFACLRNELCQRLAKDAGFPDTQSFRGAAVFLNGSYYGFEWLEQLYDSNYFHERYGTNESQGSWEIVTPHRGAADTASEEELDIQAVRDINLTYSYQNLDLTDDRLFQELSGRLDIDNFLQYCALEIYLSNPDWPDNNCRVYRWYSSNGSYAGNYTDGRWRYVLYDMDICLARTGSSEAENPTLGEVLGAVESNWNRKSYLLPALLRRPDMQERFTEIMEEMMEGAFSYEHASEVLDGMAEEMSPEIDYYFRKAEADEEDAELTPEEGAARRKERYEEELQNIREFLRLRPQTMREELERLPEYIRTLEEESEES